ncbi:hypothetical protein AB1N83_012041 [Pleurotus pulmonarius]
MELQVIDRLRRVVGKSESLQNTHAPGRLGEATATHWSLLEILVTTLETMAGLQYVQDSLAIAQAVTFFTPGKSSDLSSVRVADMIDAGE